MKASSLLSACALCLVSLLLGACNNGGETEQPSSPPVVGVIDAQPRTTPLTKDLVGRLSAYRKADVRARVAGILLKRTYKEGSTVEAGQLLFKIDPAPLQATLDSAKAELAQAKASATNARVKAKRARKLAPKGYISQADLDDTKAAERTAEAAVKAAQARVESARINLGYASVTSPIDGRAGRQQVTEGALVGQSGVTLLTTVEQVDPLYVHFTISIGELNQLRLAAANGTLELSEPGKATIKVSTPDGTPYPKTGTVDFSSPSVDPATGAVTLRALLPNPEYALMPGSYVNVQLSMGERHGIFLIPQLAVQRDVTGPYVLTVGDDNTISRHDIVTTGMNGQDWVVTSGVQAGDRVIVTGIQMAQPGGKAKTQPWQPSESTDDHDTDAMAATRAAANSHAE